MGYLGRGSQAAESRGRACVVVLAALAVACPLAIATRSSAATARPSAGLWSGGPAGAVRALVTGPEATGVSPDQRSTSGGASVTLGAGFAGASEVLAPPKVTDVEPTFGPTNGETSITIEGTNFAGATEVHFGAAASASFSVDSATEITAVSPAQGTINPTTVDVTVTTPGGTSGVRAQDRYTYLPQPFIHKIRPIHIPVTGWPLVKIFGLDLQKATSAHFGTIETAVRSVNQELVVVEPAPVMDEAAEVNVTVTTPGGTSEDKLVKFTPVVSSLSPSTGPSAAAGTSVTVTGHGFAIGAGAARFKFGSAKASDVDCTSHETCTLLSPAHVAGRVLVTATVNSATSNTKAFTYE